MEQVSFDNLRVLAEKKPWRTLNHEIRACDGAAWNIKLYSDKGTLLNSSGRTYYIYGEEVLVKIVDALPDKKENRFENYKDVKESYLMSYEKFVQLFKQE